MSVLQAAERPSFSLADLAKSDAAGHLSSIAIRDHTRSLPPPPSPSPTLLRRISATPGLMLYTVLERDSFPGIAVRFNTTSSVLQRLNRLPNQSIFPGQHLVVPDPESVTSPTEHTFVSASRASSGVSCGSGSTQSSQPASRHCSAGQVTSAQSTSSDQGISFRGCPAPASGSSPIMVKESPSVASSGIGDEYVMVSTNHFSPVTRGDGANGNGEAVNRIPRDCRKLEKITADNGDDANKTSIFPTNCEPLPLQVVTDSLLAIDAQLADMEEGIVRGTLRITKERISFQPWGADRLVQARGVDLFVRNMQWSSVTSLGMYPDLVKMSTMDVPLVMRRNGGGAADFSFVSSQAWSRLAPRAHCTKVTAVPTTTAASNTTTGAAISPLASPASGTSSGSQGGIFKSSSASNLSPAIRLRSTTSANTPPTSRAGSGSRLGQSPASSPFRQRKSIGDSVAVRSPKKLSFFRQRSASVEVDDASKWLLKHLQLPGYLNIRTQPLDQENSDASKELTFVVSGTQKELLFDFFMHNLPHVQQVDFSDLVVLYANLRADANAIPEAAGGDDDDAGNSVRKETNGDKARKNGDVKREGGELRTISPGPDESPHHPAPQRERSSSFTAGTAAARSSIGEDTWELVSPTECNSLKPQRSISLPEAPSLETESQILSDAQLTQLSNKLPLPLLGHTWKLAYSTYVSGISLKTMYRNCLKATDGPVLLVVRDEMQHVFGALSSCTLRISDTYDGNGTSFLYTFHRSHECTVFPWTGENSFFYKGDTDSMSFGGGRGKFGLWLDGDFYHGASHSCPTFDNEVLAHQTDFICAGIEAWYFG